jgi:ABC-2 type transport system ATP-binding protein
MSQKVQFIATVVSRPELIILDEPFTGLDPVNADVLTGKRDSQQIVAEIMSQTRVTSFELTRPS